MRGDRPAVGKHAVPSQQLPVARTSYRSVRTPSAAATTVSSFSLCCCASDNGGYLPGLAGRGRREGGETGKRRRRVGDSRLAVTGGRPAMQPRTSMQHPHLGSRPSCRRRTVAAARRRTSARWPPAASDGAAALRVDRPAAASGGEWRREAATQLQTGWAGHPAHLLHARQRQQLAKGEEAGLGGRLGH